ncbi:MAG: hypothetical protein HPY58_13890 [Firmicutes bacterium]|nr:hypothetical protein [Bacillota bacterium]
MSRLKNHSIFWTEFQALDLSEFRRDYLLPMAGQQLLSRVDEHTVTVGQQWAVLKRYYWTIADLRRPDSEAEMNLRALAKNQDWFREDVITLELISTLRGADDISLVFTSRSVFAVHCFPPS